MKRGSVSRAWRLMAATWFVERGMKMLPAGFPGRADLARAQLTIINAALEEFPQRARQRKPE